MSTGAVSHVFLVQPWGQAVSETNYILHGRSTGCQTRRAHEACKEAEDEQTGVVVDERRRDAENDEQGEADHVRHVAAEDGNLAQW